MVTTVWRTLLVLWLAAVWIVISVPGGGFNGTPHWENVQWIPLNGYVLTSSTLVEMGANFLAFIPIGYLTIRCFDLGSRPIVFLAASIGFVASLSIEVYQFFCDQRVPSVTDVVVNTAGAVLGAKLALKLDELITVLSRRAPLSPAKSEDSNKHATASMPQ